MAQDVVIANAQYSDVPAISVPTQGGGTASFVDTSDANAAANEIDEGKTAYVGGVKVTGTRSGGGGGGGSYTAGDGIDITNDVISLKTASADDIGGIKVGSGLSIDASGKVDADIYNLKTPLLSAYIVADDGGDYFTNTANEVILQENDQTFKKYNNLPAIAGVYHRRLYRTPLLVSTIEDAVKIQQNNATPTSSQGSFVAGGITWYYSRCDSNNYRWDASYVAQNFPTVNNGTQYTDIETADAAKKLVEEANPTFSATESVEENLFYPASVSLSSGDTITDSTLKSLVVYHRPININGKVYYFVDFENGSFIYKNTIYTVSINSESWVITITANSGSTFTQMLLYTGNWTSGQISLSESMLNFDDLVLILNNGSRNDLAWAVTDIMMVDIVKNSTSSAPVTYYGEGTRKFSFYYVSDTKLSLESRDTYGVKRIYGRKY